MSHKLAGSFAVLTMSLAVSLAHGEPRRGGGGGRSGGERSTEERSGEERSGERSGSERSSSQSKKGKKPPGGDWSESNSEGKQGKEQSGKEGNKSGEEGAAAGAAHSNRNSSQASGAEGAAAGAAHSNKNSPQATGAEGAAAGAAASNRNSPKASGAEGAAAGAAASNRNEPQHSGAEGAAAGAAASNRNNPKYSGAQGAAAGAAASNRNSPQYSGAQGAAAGAAVSNRNNPQYSGAQGAAVGAAVANQNSPQYSGAAGAAAGYAAVRNNVNHPGMYSQQWYGAHQGAWVATGWNADAAWTAPTWAAVAGQFGYDNAITPITYNYGSNVTCIGGNVVVDGRPAGTAEEFSLEADELAEKGTTAATSPSDQWLPLGVFALVRNEQQHPQLIMQLAINQAGILRGNYTDEITDSTLPVHGAVDRKTQRVAFTIGENKYSVMEVGLNNLTQSEAPALIHKNGTTQKWLLVRLSQASQAGNDAAAK
jgi:hypothetical protein